MIITSMFIMLSSSHSHCESSPSSLDECRLTARWLPTLKPSEATWAGSLPAGCYHPNPPSPFITGTIAWSTKCRYLSYSEADSEVLRPYGQHTASMGMTKGPLLHAKLHPHWSNGKGIGPPKLKFLLRFDQNVEYKCPTGAYPLRDFHKLCKVCTPFQDALAVKISGGFA